MVAYDRREIVINEITQEVMYLKSFQRLWKGWRSTFEMHQYIVPGIWGPSILQRRFWRS